MTVYNAVNNRTTDDVIIITFINWTSFKLYDSRETLYDVPNRLENLLVASVNTTNDLTIIEV